MKKLISLCLITISVLFTACSKIDLTSSMGPIYNGPTVDDYKFFRPALGFIQLPVNQYFIYKDAATGSTDSVVVIESVLGSNFVAATQTTNAASYETYHLALASYSSAGYQIWYTGNATANTSSGFSLTTGTSPLPAFCYPFASTASTQYDHISTLTIEGTVYSGVEQFVSSNGLPATDVNYLKTIYCWASGIGIIKREITTNSSVKTSLLVRHG